MEALLKQLQELDIMYIQGAELSHHSTFRIGGIADVAVFPKTSEQMVTAITAARDRGIRYTVIGRGSNVLFADEGYRGMVVFTSGLSEIAVQGETICAGSGALLSQIALVAEKNGLTGFEFAQGIPGSLGGAVYMNAGAYGKCLSDVLIQSTYLDPAMGTVGSIDGSAHEFGNRTSVYMGNGCVILGGQLRLAVGDRRQIRAQMEEYKKKRRATQPLEYPSAGSVFKRPEGYFAGKLIEDAGLKGVRIGGAEVSPMHAGFIVNVGGATAGDVLSLIRQIQEVILKRTGVQLEPEIRYIPADGFDGSIASVC